MVMERTKTRFVWVVVGVLGSMAAASGAIAGPEAAPAPDPSEPASGSGLLLVEEDVHPRVRVSWVVGGQERGHSGAMPFTAPIGGESIGKNVKCYVTMGGTRVETGAGHPKGAVIRLGVTKIDNARAFFAGIDPHTSIEFAVTGIKFNQPVKYHQGTGMMHLKYALGDLAACELPATARNQYLLSDPDDTLGGRVVAGENATPGALDGQANHGEFSIEIDPDDPTMVSMRLRVPFGMLRHLQDPWKSDLPGTFFEPIHMHAEAELIPVDADPLDRPPYVPEINPPEINPQPQGQPSDQDEDGKVSAD